jgi:hypothetical protein
MLISGSTLLLIAFSFFQTHAQQGISPLLPDDCVYTIEHDTLISPTEFQFDLYLRDTDPTQPFLISLIQAGILAAHPLSEADH